MAAKDFKARSVGIVIDPLRLVWSKLDMRRYGSNDNVTMFRHNFFKVDLSEATILTLHQGHEINKMIREKLAEDLTPSARVVAYRFTLEGWTSILYNKDLSFYLYEIQR